MKNFLKTFSATLAAMFIFGIVFFFIMMSIINGLGSLFDFGTRTVTMPDKAVLTIDMSQIELQEQTQEPSIMEMLYGESPIQPMGTLDIIAAIDAASYDPAVEYIFLKPDGVTGGMAQIEEVRKALLRFRDSGKAVVSYIENPTNGGYYLATASDKIYMTRYNGGFSMFNGLSSQMFFLKDALDRLGINVQLIRHGKYKSAGEMFVRNSSSEENLEQNQEMIDSMWESWCSDMAQAREIEAEEINRMLENLELKSPADFLENGLVDQLMTLDELHEKLALLYMTDSYKDVESISIQDYAILNDAGSPYGNDKIAVIFADGNIIDGYSFTDVAADRFVEIIQDVRNDESVKAVVLRVNSPGGSVLAAEKIKAQIDSLSSSVPVIASFGDYAASGGYWIAADCDYIYTNRTTLTGSIGVFSLIPDFNETINGKLHVNITSVNSNSHADMYNMLRPLSEEETGYMQSSVEDIYDRFTSIVAEGRDMDITAVDSLGQGRIWTGAQAVSNGLADAVGGIDDALIHAAMLTGNEDGFENIKVEVYPKPLTNMDIITSLITGEPMQIAEPFRSIYNAFSSWNESQSGKVYARLPYAIDIK
jgi:protease-4